MGIRLRYHRPRRYDLVEMPLYEVSLSGTGFHVPVQQAIALGEIREDARDIKVAGAMIQQIMTSRRVRAANPEAAFVAARNKLCAEGRVADYVRISVMAGHHPEFEVLRADRVSWIQSLFSRCDERLVMADNSEYLV